MAELKQRGEWAQSALEWSGNEMEQIRVHISSEHNVAIILRIMNAMHRRMDAELWDISDLHFPIEIIGEMFYFEVSRYGLAHMVHGRGRTLQRAGAHPQT